MAALSNNGGNLAESYRYTPFGSVTFFDIAGQPTGASAVQNPYLFTARRCDDETGLYYYRARMYNPQLGRFMQPDPAGYIDTMNLYAYCGNNPVNWVDPWGLLTSLEDPRGLGTVNEMMPGTAEGIGNALQTIKHTENAIKVATMWERIKGFILSVAVAVHAVDSADSPKDCPDWEKYPENPDDWKVPEGWTETNAGEKTDGRHRQWIDENGNMRRRWDREGREGGKPRGPHWHDFDDPSGGQNHIPGVKPGGKIIIYEA